MSNATHTNVLEARQARLLECACIEKYTDCEYDHKNRCWIYFTALRSRYIARTAYSIDLLYESNYVAMEERHPDLVNCNGELCNKTLESYSEDEFEAVLDTFQQLSDYPIIDEDLHSRMEWELEEEARSECLGYVSRAVEEECEERGFEFDEDLLEDSFRRVWEDHCGNGRCHEECGIWYYDEKEIVSEVLELYFVETKAVMD